MSHQAMRRELLHGAIYSNSDAETISLLFADCVASGSVLSDDMREISFSAVLSELDLLDRSARNITNSIDWLWSCTNADFDSGRVHNAIHTIRDMLYYGAQIVALATVHPEIFMPMVFDWNVAMWPYREQLQAWRDHPELVEMRSRVCDAIRKRVWWLQ